jgi:hypothetical protein
MFPSPKRVKLARVEVKPDDMTIDMFGCYFDQAGEVDRLAMIDRQR